MIFHRRQCILSPKNREAKVGVTLLSVSGNSSILVLVWYPRGRQNQTNGHPASRGFQPLFGSLTGNMADRKHILFNEILEILDFGRNNHF